MCVCVYVCVCWGVVLQEGGREGVGEELGLDCGERGNTEGLSHHHPAPLLPSDTDLFVRFILKTPAL